MWSLRVFLASISYSWHRFEYAQKVGQRLRDMWKPCWEDDYYLDRWVCLENLTREESRRLPNHRTWLL